MKLLKISIFCKSFDFIYDFKKNNGNRSFWEVFGERVAQKHPDYAVKLNGSVQAMFYIPTDEEPAEFRVYIEDLLEQFLDEPNNCSLSCVELTREEINKIEDKNITEKPWFKELVSDMSNSAGAKKTQSPAPRVSGANRLAPSAPAAPGKKSAETPETAEAPKTLFEEAERIAALKQKLSERVIGQQHAVDEVVQTVFECDAFTSLKAPEERRGPLASFLFTGPSGVGKTLLSKTLGEVLGRKTLLVDMSTFSDNLANNKFNGDHGEQALVTGFVKENPDGVIIFDEIEKAHMNTLYLFLQILDEGHLMDMRIKKNVSFKNNIVIITTNAGKTLYEDPTVTNLSGVPRRVILDALRKDVNPQTGAAFFPEFITTRFANGHVVLFNHLEPYALMEIIKKTILEQTELFKKSYGIDVSFDINRLAALVLYSAGGISDARTLIGMTKSIVVKELMETVMQTYFKSGRVVDTLKKIEIVIATYSAGQDVKDLFESRKGMNMVVFADDFVAKDIADENIDNLSLKCFSELSAAKSAVRGVVDCVLIDPAAGLRDMVRVPNDIEDVRSDGMELFSYVAEYYPELPIYILDTRMRGEDAFATLLSKGARGIARYDSDNADKLHKALMEISLTASINNASYSVGRAGKFLSYNCSQYTLDETTAVISFEKLALKVAPISTDKSSMAVADSMGVTFKDVIGCTAAKEALTEYISFIKDPRAALAKGLKVPKGILLYGPPGTGKTMLAKAMANECGAAFFPIAATSFFNPYVGQTDINIREMFSRARRYAPSIIFIDEADAIARQRTGGISGHHSEEALTTFLSEMDGFKTDEKRPVFIIAATNYAISGTGGMVLDAAFVRRFDRRIFVDLPDEDARLEFIKVKLTRHAIDFGVDNEKVLLNFAKRTSGMSNADLDIIIEKYVRETAGREPVPGEFMDAIDAFRFGEVNKIDPLKLRQTACHESGHALINRLLGNKVSFLTVVSRGNFGGYMEHESDETKGNYTFNELMDRVCCALAGRAAEILVYGNDLGLNTGASSDIRNARQLIRSALDDYAMGDNLFSRTKVAECESLIQKQYDRAAALLTEHRETLDRLTELLLKHKSLDQTMLESFFADEIKQ